MATSPQSLQPSSPPHPANEASPGENGASAHLLNEPLQVVRVGVILSIVTILFGFVLGGVLGGVEDSVKAHLRATAEANAAIYAGDQARLDSTLGRAFTYMKRAHMHGGGIGTATLAIVLVLAFLRRAPSTSRSLIATALGVGGLGYSVFWMIAGLRTPALGSTGAAKESLAWLAEPSAGLLLLGVTASLVLLIRELFFRAK